MSFRGSAFAMTLHGDVVVPGRWATGHAAQAPLQLAVASRDRVEGLWSGTQQVGWEGRADDLPFVAEIGHAGDLRFRHGEALDAWLSPDGRALLVAPDKPDTQGLRALVDSVLFTVSLWRGHEALHAAAVVVDGRGVAITGASGAGKSSLLAALLDAGAGFLADDVVVLEGRDASVHGLAAPPFATVPANRDTAWGLPIADVGDERWVSVTPVCADAPLVAVCALFTPGRQSRPAWAALLDGMLRFPRTPERLRARADLAMQLASTASTIQLPAHGAPPAALAQTVLDAVRISPSRPPSVSP